MQDDTTPGSTENPGSIESQGLPQCPPGDERRSAARELVNSGARAQLQGKLIDAETAYLAAISMDPENATAWNNLGFIYAQRGLYDEALDRYRQAIQIDPNRTITLINLANALIMNKEMQAGLDALDRALALNPESSLAWDSRGRAMMALGRLDEAEANFRSALQGEDKASTLAALGLVLAAKGKSEEAVQVLRRACHLEPASSYNWSQLGMVLFSRSDLGSAADAMRTSLAIDPDNSDSRYQLAIVLVALGDVSGAARELLQVISDHPKHVAAKVDLAVLEISQGLHEKALKLLQEMLALQSADLEASDQKGYDQKARYYLALALSGMGRSEEARAVMQSLAVLGSKYGELARQHLEGDQIDL